MSHAAHGGDASGAPAVVAATVLLLGYAAAVAALQVRTGRPWRSARSVAFAAGVVTAALALSPVVGEVAGSPARAHMAQHVLLGMVAPLGLVLGAPSTLVLAVLPIAARRRGTAALRSHPVRVLTHPLVAGCLHVGGLYLLYLTPLYARTLESPPVHGLVLAHFLLAGTLFTFSLIGPERAARRPGTAGRLGVLIAASAAHGHLARLLHVRAPELPPGGSHPAADLQDAARWMSGAGDVVEVVLAVVLLAGWHRRAGRRARHAATLAPAS